MADEAIEASQQNFCEVTEEMAKSMASVRELIQGLREKYVLHIWYRHTASYRPSAQTRKDVRSRLQGWHLPPFLEASSAPFVHAISGSPPIAPRSRPPAHNPLAASGAIQFF